MSKSILIKRVLVQIDNNEPFLTSAWGAENVYRNVTC